MKPLAVLSCLAALLAACSTAAAPPTRILFTSMRDGNWEVYLMNADGSGQTNLTDDPGQDTAPACSADGRRIAFQFEQDSLPDIYVMRDDGSGRARLTDDPGSDQWPAWTPDGRIGFCSDRVTQPGFCQIYLMDASGHNQARLIDSDYSDADAAWSPDGTRIAFDSMRNGRLGIYVISADGTGLTNLTNSTGAVPKPTALPGGAQAIVIGSDWRQDQTPSWSPDGSRIVYESARGDNFEIYVMNDDGTGEANLTNHPAYDGMPSWSRDGLRIAFVSDRDGSMEIYVMNADGSGVTRLTDDAEGNLAPKWCP